jgi:hypothetical protein
MANKVKGFVKRNLGVPVPLGNLSIRHHGRKMKARMVEMRNAMEASEKSRNKSIPFEVYYVIIFVLVVTACNLLFS